MRVPDRETVAVLAAVALVLSGATTIVGGQDTGNTTTSTTNASEGVDLSAYSPTELRNLSNEQIQDGLEDTDEEDLTEAQKEVLNERLRADQDFFNEFVGGIGSCAGAPIDCALGNTRAAGEGLYEFGGGSGDIVPSGGDVAADVANWTKERANETIRPVLGVAMEFIVGTPTPENRGWRGIIGPPTNSTTNSSLAQGVWQTGYNEVYLDYSFLYSFVFLMVCAISLIGVYPWQGLLHSYAKYKIVSAIVLATLILTLWWPIGTFLLKISDAVAASIAPTPVELTSSLGDILKAGSSTILLALAKVLFGVTEIALLALVYGLRWGLIMVGMFAMPLILVLALVGPHPRLRQLGGTLAWQFIGLLVMTWPVAFMMRLGYELQWSFSVSGLANFVLSLAMLAIGLVIPLVISISLLRAPPSITAIAAGATGAAASMSLRDGDDDYYESDNGDNSSNDGGSNDDSGSDGGSSPGIEPHPGPTPADRIAVVVSNGQAGGSTSGPPHTITAGAPDTGDPQHVTARQVIDAPSKGDGNDPVSATDRLEQQRNTALVNTPATPPLQRSSESAFVGSDTQPVDNTPALSTPEYVPSSSEAPAGDRDTVETTERKREQTRDGGRTDEVSTLEQRRRLHDGTSRVTEQSTQPLSEDDATSHTDSTATGQAEPTITRTHDGPSTLSDERWAALTRRYGDPSDGSVEPDTTPDEEQGGDEE